MARARLAAFRGPCPKPECTNMCTALVRGISRAFQEGLLPPCPRVGAGRGSVLKQGYLTSTMHLRACPLPFPWQGGVGATLRRLQG